MADSDTVPLHPRSSQSDIDEIENLINVSVQPVTSAVPISSSAIVPVARPESPPRASIPVSSSSTYTPKISSSPAPVIPSVPAGSNGGSGNRSGGIASDGFGLALNTLTEPVWEMIKRDVLRISNNLKLVDFPNPYCKDPGKALRDWDVFFFVIFLGKGSERLGCLFLRHFSGAHAFLVCLD